MSVQTQRGPVDAMIETYVDWLKECAALAQAYRQWGRAAVGDRDLAFAAYRAALDREQQASAVYSELIERVRREMETAGFATGDWPDRLEDTVGSSQ